MTFHTVEGLDHWAPALINNDYTELDNDDQILIDEWLATHNISNVVDVSEHTEFSWLATLRVGIDLPFAGASIVKYTVEKGA